MAGCGLGALSEMPAQLNGDGIGSGSFQTLIIMLMLSDELVLCWDCWAVSPRGGGQKPGLGSL